MYNPVNPNLTVWKLGLRGSECFSHVFVMTLCIPDTPWMSMELTCCHVISHANNFVILSQLLPLAQWSTTHKPSIRFLKSRHSNVAMSFYEPDLYFTVLWSCRVFDVNRSIIFRVWLAKWQSSNWHLNVKGRLSFWAWILVFNLFIILKFARKRDIAPRGIHVFVVDVVHDPEK